MKITITIRAKYFAVAGLLGLVFLGGYRTKAYQDAHPVTRVDASAIQPVLTVPDGTSQETWCASHPSTSWTLHIPIADQTRGFVPLSGTCDASGGVWTLTPNNIVKPVDPLTRALNDPFANGAQNPIPDGTTPESWCLTHPSSGWIISAEALTARYGLTTNNPGSGSCDANGKMREDINPK
jgi:hypothetical protein